MARGFESKSVADQQESAQDERRPREDLGDPALLSRRRKLELARTDLVHQLEVARAEAHREMLRRALAAVEQQLSSLS